MRITFEGEHRSGKGTQIDLYKQGSESDLLVLRGDGSYQGGLSGILDETEICLREEINSQLYSEHTAKVKGHLWSVAAHLCAETILSSQFKDRSLLIDRGPLSRASFLLSTGLEGKELLDNMYPAYDFKSKHGVIHGGPINVESVDFGRIIYLQVPMEVLLERISDNDEKADFRRKNIIAKKGLFEKAIEALPKSVQSSVEVINGDRHPDEIYQSYS
ncbi:MAG: hypothetical protein ABI303_02755 [Candidatus Saccharimonas sp.]